MCGIRLTREGDLDIEFTHARLYITALTVFMDMQNFTRMILW